VKRKQITASAEKESETLENVGKYRAPALEKGIDILELLSSERVPMTLSAICARLKRSTGEIFRMVQVLQDRGFLAQDPETGGCYLTDLLFSMAMRQPVTQSLVEVALPAMRTLATEIGQSCHLVLHARGDIVVVARMESMEQLGFTVRVGYRRPITDTVSGTMLFAYQPADVRARWIEMIEPKPSSATIEKLIANAKIARKRGFARAPSAFVSGVTDISAPILRGDRAAAVLTVPHIRTAFSKGPIDLITAKVREAAGRIAAKLTEGDSRA
jgi:DNA-binding IclR family transcriptional regulator